MEDDYPLGILGGIFWKLEKGTKMEKNGKSKYHFALRLLKQCIINEKQIRRVSPSRPHNQSSQKLKGI